MTDSSASEPSGDSQKKDAKHPQPCGRLRKRPAEEVEPFEDEVLIESAAAALSNCNRRSNLEKPVCSLQIPNHLLLKWHKERAGMPYSRVLRHGSMNVRTTKSIRTF